MARLLAAWLFCVVALVSFSWGMEDQKTLRLMARIHPKVSLILDRSQVTFAGAEDQAIIPAAEGAVQVTAKGAAGVNRPLVLTMRAENDLEGSAGRIPIHQVRWTALGEGFRDGSLSRAADKILGRWTSSGVHRGQVNFELVSPPEMAAGEYQSQVTLTLASP
ncbi:MAG: hypothetical protein FJ126_01685 [Deltaproteobacteria bacterium]|nr:hypothetical protein [Deltaproteobacteria bacterium]MBM4293601.1 hypothetical protein [Deltaproteobacteria bacterium]